MSQKRLVEFIVLETRFLFLVVMQNSIFYKLAYMILILQSIKFIENR